MASIVFLMYGGIGAFKGIAIGSGFFASRYIFDSTAPLYMGIATGIISTLYGFHMWGRKRINENKEREIFHPDYITGTGFVAFGAGCVIPVTALPLLISIIIPCYKYLIAPATRSLVENFKHQHNL